MRHDNPTLPRFVQTLLRYRQILYFALLLALNAFIVRRLFVTEFTEHMNSNEGTFMAISRFILTDWPHWSWYPRWFNGVPFQNTYSPLLQFLDAGVALAAHCSTALAYHAVTAFFYSLGPALLFLFAWKVSGLLETSLSAALLYSLLSPSAIFPLVYNDIFGWRHARRLHTLVHYGEGAHNIVLSLLPAALLLLYFAVTRRRLRWYIATGAFFGVVVLFNAFGAVDLALGAVCLLLTFSRELRLRDLAVLAGTAVFSYLWISPFLYPSLIQTIRINSQRVEGDYRYTPLSTAVLLIVLVGWLVLWYLTRGIQSRFDRFVLLFAFIFTAIPGLWVWANIALAPQPERYHLEMEMGLCLAAIFLARHLLTRFNHYVKIAIVLIFAAFLARQSIAYSRYAGRLIRSIDITTTVEYKMAKWIDRNLPGLRSLVSDEGGTWFNVFTDNPQLSSGHDPFSPNWTVEVATYAIYGGETEGHNASLAWLKALGCHAVTVPGSNSRQTYKPFRRPKKFDGVLPVLWRDEDDTIYAVPQRSKSLAHVIPATAAIQHPPLNGVDLTELSPFVAALENPRLPLADMQWVRSGHAHISARVEPDQVMAIQITYDPGWTATANGRPAAITRDGIGLITVHPDCSGACEVELVFKPGLERSLCWLVSALVSAGVLAFVACKTISGARSPTTRVGTHAEATHPLS